jgi:uncharacterized protein
MEIFINFGDHEDPTGSHERYKMKVLVLCGDAWHPPEIVRRGLGALVGEEYRFDWIEDARDWTPDIMAAYPLVILTKSDNVSHTDKTSWMTDSVQAAFSDYVRRGTGLFAIHSGTAEYEHKPVIRGLLGGVFLHHPEQCLVTMRPRTGHTLCNGVAQFSRKDEHYFMILDDQQADVFLTTSSINGEQPGGWRRVTENGRVAVLTPGHNLEVWLHPSYQALLRNLLEWCAKIH